MNTLQWICHFVPRVRAGGGAVRVPAATELVNGRWQVIGAPARAVRRVAAPAAAGAAASGGLVLVCHQTGWPALPAPAPVPLPAPWGPSAIPVGYGGYVPAGPGLFSGGPGGLVPHVRDDLPGSPTAPPGAIPGQPVAVPEPGAALLFVGALAALILARWVHKHMEVGV